MTFATHSPLLPEILALHGKWRGPDVAAIADEGVWTWREFVSHSHAFGNGLLAHGVAPGDRVGLLMSNGLPMLQAMFGVIAAGAVVVPLNTSVSDAAALAMLDDAAVTAVVASDDLLQRLDNIAKALNHRPLRIAPTPSAGGWHSFIQVTANQSVARPDVVIEGHDLINIIYSSGTTGLPKGITHSHQGRRDWAYDLAIALRYHGGARTLLTIGLYSNISWVAMLTTLLAGGCIHVVSRFDAGRALDYIADHRITHTAMVPIQYQRLMETAATRDDVDVTSMQAMMSCGSPLRESLKRDIFGRFDCGVIELYGLTEGIITTLEPEHAVGRWSSVGRPLLGTDICIVDADDNPVQAGDVGEVCARGRIAMPGYWQRPDADAESTYTDPEGSIWLRSGDIGTIDAEGYLYIVDRKKDMILSGGQNVYPQDIEAVIAEHPNVADVAVIGLNSERWGETPVALVVWREQAGAEPAALLEWVNQRVGKQQRIADVIVAEELPRNPNGKILKRDLRQQHGDRCYA